MPEPKEQDHHENTQAAGAVPELIDDAERVNGEEVPWSEELKWMLREAKERLEAEDKERAGPS